MMRPGDELAADHSARKSVATIAAELAADGRNSDAQDGGEK